MEEMTWQGVTVYTQPYLARERGGVMWERGRIQQMLKENEIRH
jgi:hypothetical protein